MIVSPALTEPVRTFAAALDELKGLRQGIYGR